MTSQEFLKPRLVGRRFEEHSIPLDIFNDLSVLNEMILEVAKWKYLIDHTDRKRIPRGFTGGIELRLAAIEECSVRPVIVLFVAAMGLLPTGNHRYLESARDAIIRAIEAAEHNRLATEFLPENLLSYFDRIGRSLQDGEAIEFQPPGQTTSAAPARLTRETRRKLILTATNTQTFSEERTLRGRISAADKDKKTFEIQTWDGRKYQAPILPQFAKTLLEAFMGYEQGARVLLKGIGQLNRQGRLEAFEAIEHVIALDPLDVPCRIEELRSLKDGWYEGRGKAPRTEDLDWLSSAFEAHFPDDLRLPYLYPTGEGGIQAEWSISGKEISLDIDLAQRSGSWHSLDLNTQEDTSETISLSNSEGWTHLAELLEAAGGKIV